MVKTGIVRDPRYLQHITSEYHPENHRRLEVIYEMLNDEDMLGKYEDIQPRLATEEELELIHVPEYISRVAATEGISHVMLDPDTQTSPKSYEAARLAVGGVLESIDGIMAGDIQNGFALVRPPGHHAESDRGMGFCLFNNVAVGAQYAITKHSLDRILIVDWDLHHGNGTQNTFYNTPNVLYFSTHQFPYYPGTGSLSETGSGNGQGFTVNVPLSGGQGDEDYAQIFKKILHPICCQYKPQFIIVSAGFDTYFQDPLGSMKITPRGFAELTQSLLEISHINCADRILFVLEGGYHLDGLRESVKVVLKQLMGESSLSTTETPEKPHGSQYIDSLIHRVADVQKEFWRLSTV